MHVVHIAVDCCQAFSMSCRFVQVIQPCKYQTVLAVEPNSLHMSGIA